MKKISDIFSEAELDYIAQNKPNLVPMDVPSESDANLLKKPTLDQIIVKFLKLYEVEVEPRSVGQWNGWDTLSSLSILAGIVGGSAPNRSGGIGGKTIISALENNSRDISNSVRSGAIGIAAGNFFANRSNQINAAALDWGTWKRWALDHQDFTQYKDHIMQAIELHNKKVIDEVKKKIKQAKLNNEKVALALKESEAKEYISKLIERNQLLAEEEKQFRDQRSTKFICIMFFYVFLLFIIALFSSRIGEYSSEGDKDRQSLNYSLIDYYA